MTVKFRCFCACEIAGVVNCWYSDVENDNAAVVNESLETFIKAINNCSACSVLFLSTTGLFPACRKNLEHETQSSTLTFFQVLETILECSKTVLNTLNHCLLHLDNFNKRHFSLSCISTDLEHI